MKNKTVEEMKKQHCIILKKNIYHAILKIDKMFEFLFGARKNFLGILFTIQFQFVNSVNEKSSLMS